MTSSHGWNLVNNPNSLSVRVLGAKYGCGWQPVPVMKTSQSSSHLWRGVVKHWNHVVEDGDIPLDFVNHKTAQYVRNGNWDCPLLSNLLSRDACDFLAATRPPSLEEGDNADKAIQQFKFFEHSDRPSHSSNNSSNTNLIC
ncbi:hypothetical protein RIF29_16482 [Crotalaria pallida]|uniref:Uncharacterized protein n=1 Tax=Crotalaria pallida TaxID=3830 RepID=A0AAN9IJV2_CROPI